MDQVECVVIGAGVVGLAVARALALAGREVLVLDAASGIGTGISSRNSEVIHAGLHGSANWLKVRLCVQGRSLLYNYCQARGVDHRRCGKLLVATSSAELPQLQALAERAAANGVDDLQLLTSAQARAMEPALMCEAALWSPSSGIIDSHGLMLAFQGDLENAGGLVVLNSPVAKADCTRNHIDLHMADGTVLRTGLLVNSAGLQASALAASFSGLAPIHVPQTRFAKGNYFLLQGRAPFSRLIYPMPQAGGLGVHLTIDLGGQARFGPDVQWVDSADDWVVDPARGNGFYAEVRRYWPGLAEGALQPGYAGIRPKLHAPNESARDFLIQGPATHGVPGLVNLFGIESPGLTSSLAIAEHVLAMVAG
jgi:L-2-hydroxyglutarate oxidase LhgO